MIQYVNNLLNVKANKGLNTSPNIFSLTQDYTPACIDMDFNEDGSFSKRLGSSTMNTVVLESTGGYGMMDCGIADNIGGNDGNTKLLLHCNGADGATVFTDASPSKHTVTAFGSVQIDTAQSKFGGASAYCPSTSGDYLQVAASTDFDFTSDFTLESHIRLSALISVTAQDVRRIISRGAVESGIGDWCFGIGYTSTYGAGSNPVINFAWRRTDSTIMNLSSNALSFNTGSWYHIAIVRSSNVINFYLDGSGVGGPTATFSDTITAASVLRLFVRDSGALMEYFPGWQDEIRISNKARWTGTSFTLATAEYFPDLLQRRRLMCASGTGIYYSEDIGKTWAIAQTSRTAVINYFSVIKEFIINTNENYDVPQYWAGTAGTYFATIAPNSAPTCKHSASFQGFAFLLNAQDKPRQVYYVDENNMLTASAWSNFQLPTDRNDELTAGFILGRNFYISSKFKIFRLGYIGGNPDWTYKEIKNWGFVTKTIKKVNIPNVGEVIIGLDWEKNIRVFDGNDDNIISAGIKLNNQITPFYLDNLQSLDFKECWAEDDKPNHIYRLFLPYAGSGTVTHAICYDYRIGSFFPYQGQNYQSGVLASDTADGLRMLACNYNGRVHILNSGNADAGTAIDEQYVSPLIFSQSPTKVQKSQEIDLFFKPTSSGTIYLEDRTQFSNVWNLRKTFTLASAISNVMIQQSVDIPESMNVYQYKLSSSANTAESWKCFATDYSFSQQGAGKP